MEFEYEIPCQDADALLNICEKPLIEKIRYTVETGGMVWEIDEFAGDNQGLIVAEVELESEDQYFPKPDWVRKEVTGDPRYFIQNGKCQWLHFIFFQGKEITRFYIYKHIFSY